MAKEVNGYKVVRARQKDGCRQLLSASVFDPEWLVAYTSGVPTYGRGRSALFGFDSLAHARRFARVRSSSTTVQVWEARLGQPKPRKRIARRAYKYLAFWAGSRRDTFQAPVGTMVCESITLLKQVA